VFSSSKPREESLQREQSKVANENESYFLLPAKIEQQADFLLLTDKTHGVEVSEKKKKYPLANVRTTSTTTKMWAYKYMQARLKCQGGESDPRQKAGGAQEAGAHTTDLAGT